MKSAEYILNQRYKFIKKLIEAKKFNVYEVAKYFEVTPKTIIASLYSIYGRSYKIPSFPDFLSYEILSQYRNRILEPYDKNSDAYIEKLNDLGLYKPPTKELDYNSVFEKLNSVIYISQTYDCLLTKVHDYIQDPSEHNYQLAMKELDHILPHFIDALNDFTHGFTQKDIAEKYQYTKAQLNIFSIIKTAIDFEKTPSRQSISSLEDLNYVKELLENSENKQCHIAKITGLNNNLLADVISNNLILKNTDKKTNQAMKISERRQKVWDLYSKYGSTHGFTQQEIADQLGITRETVVSDIKKYKLEHLDEIDSNLLYKRRHSGEQKYFKYKEKEEKTIQLYVKIKERHPEFSNYKIISMICQKIDFTIENCNIVLTKHGYINALENQAVINGEFSKEGSLLKNHFGPGGATRELLNNSKYEYLSREEMNYRQKILKQQRITKALLDSNSNYQDIFQENHFDIDKTVNVIKEQEIFESENER